MASSVHRPTKQARTHMVMVPSEKDGLRAVLGEAHRQYTRHVNFREGWRGHLWQGRFHSLVMDESYLLATVRYVGRSPVVAKLCRYPENWPRSNSSAHLSGLDDELVKVAPMLSRIDDWRKYLAGVESNVDDDALIQKHNRTGRLLGSAQFVTELESLTGRILALKKAWLNTHVVEIGILLTKFPDIQYLRRFIRSVVWL
ncbi:MAG: transposase [Gammaproteobacteria bacterium]|nr:transposase [Gammaproteobacteria bacterium]